MNAATTGAGFMNFMTLSMMRKRTTNVLMMRPVHSAPFEMVEVCGSDGIGFSSTGQSHESGNCRKSWKVGCTIRAEGSMPYDLHNASENMIGCSHGKKEVRAEAALGVSAECFRGDAWGSLVAADYSRHDAAGFANL